MSPFVMSASKLLFPNMEHMLCLVIKGNVLYESDVGHDCD